MNDEFALVVRHLRKAYRHAGEPFVAVKDLSLEIRKGECLGLLGPNGAGKSTTMRCITGFSPVTAGEIRILGIDVHASPRQARQHLGVCSQEETLDTDFSVMAQMARYGTFFRIPTKECKVRAESLLKKFDLWEKRDELVEALSGGMKRRLQVARSLISHPEVLILDEPTTGLDPEARRVLWEVVSEYRNAGLAILLSTHYMEEAERLCDRVAIIHQGIILDCAPPKQLIEKYIAVDLVEEQIRPGVTWKRPANLEDVYLKLTGTNLRIEGES